MFSNHLTELLLGVPTGFFFLLAMFWNQVSLGLIDQYRSPKLRLRRLNINHFIAILASLFYAYSIFGGWKEQQQVLTPFDQYLLLTVIILLSSGIFSFTIYLLFSNDPGSFLPKTDIVEVYKAREIKRSEFVLAEARMRIAILEKELSVLPDNWEPPPICGLDKLNLGYPEYMISDHNPMMSESKDYSVVILPSGNAVVFITKILHSSKGDAHYHYIFHHNRQMAAEDSAMAKTMLLDFDEKPIDRYVKKNFRNVHLRQDKVMTDLPECLRRLLKQEQKLADEISAQMTSNTVLPLGVVWYYVILLMVGNKIDYIVPVTRTAKALILILSLCRFLFLGSYLTIIIKQYAK
jgi:hypothetical protein